METIAALIPSNGYRRPEGEREKPWQPVKYKPRQEQVLALHLAGLQNNEICEVLDYSASRVSVLRTAERAQQVLAQTRGEWLRVLYQDVKDLLGGT